jgi:TM2 domain-containing membrane protein YozV
MDDPYRDSSNVAATLGPNKKHCYACASILDFRAELCPRCGVRQPSMLAIAPPETALMVQGPRLPVRSNKDKTTAGVFALLLGGLGVHKFYLGHTAMGIVYLLLCWTCVPALIAFVEGILLLTMSEEKFAQRYP